MRRTLVATILMVVFVLLAATAYSEDPRKVEAMKRIEMLRIWRLTELLNLQEADAAVVFPILHKYDKTYQTQSDKREQLVQKLQGVLNAPTPTEKQIREITSQVLKVDQETMVIREKMYKDLDQILTAEQVAKYLIFEMHFKQEIDELINQVRRDKRQMQKMYKIKKFGDDPDDKEPKKD